MIAGVLVLFLGFVLMTLDKEAYGFGVLGITVGPLIVALGFGIQFYAIMHRTKSLKS